MAYSTRVEPLRGSKGRHPLKIFLMRVPWGGA